MGRGHPCDQPVDQVEAADPQAPRGAGRGTMTLVERVAGG